MLADYFVGEIAINIFCIESLLSGYLVVHLNKYFTYSLTHPLTHLHLFTQFIHSPSQTDSLIPVSSLTLPGHLFTHITQALTQPVLPAAWVAETILVLAPCPGEADPGSGLVVAEKEGGPRPAFLPVAHHLLPHPFPLAVIYYSWLTKVYRGFNNIISLLSPSQPMKYIVFLFNLTKMSRFTHTDFTFFLGGGSM